MINKLNSILFECSQIDTESSSAFNLRIFTAMRLSILHLDCWLILELDIFSPAIPATFELCLELLRIPSRTVIITALTYLSLTYCVLDLYSLFFRNPRICLVAEAFLVFGIKCLMSLLTCSKKIPASLRIVKGNKMPTILCWSRKSG